MLQSVLLAVLSAAATNGGAQLWAAAWEIIKHVRVPLHGWWQP